MNEAVDRLLRVPYLLPGLLGLAVGALVLGSPVLAVAAIGALVLTGLAMAWPPLLVALSFMAMIFDKAGLTGAKVDDFPVTASKLAVAGSMGLWTLYAAITRVRPLRWHPVLTAMGLMVVAALVSAAHANGFNTGKFVIFGLAMMTALVALTYIVLAESRLRGLYRFMSAFFIAVLALSIVRAGGGAGEAARGTGTMGDPNEWATMVLLLTPLLLGGLADEWGLLGSALRLGLLALAPVAVLKTESRAALLCSLFVVPGVLWVLRHHAKELVLAGVAGVLGLPLLLDLDALLDRFWALVGRAGGKGGVTDSSLDERTELLHQGLDLFRDHWFIGSGPGSFEKATGFVSPDGRLRPAHNTYLETAGEQGLVGLLPLALFGLTIAATVVYGLRAARHEQGRARLLGAALGVAAVALMAATLGLLTFAMFYLVLGFLLALAWNARRDPLE